MRLTCTLDRLTLQFQVLISYYLDKLLYRTQITTIIYLYMNITHTIHQLTGTMAKMTWNNHLLNIFQHIRPT